MANTKEATRSALLDLYEQKGKAVALAVAKNMLSLNLNKRTDVNDFRRDVNGELGEAVLEILIEDFGKQHKELTKNWFYTKSMILKDPYGNKEFMTELDFTLFTERCIYLFECKSYTGNKILVDNGLIQRKDRKGCDVYKQNCLHLKTLDKNVKSFAIVKPAYRMVLFDFSEGTMTDCRTEQAKIIMPCVTIDNWESILLRSGPVCWDLNKLKPVVSKIVLAGGLLHDKHLEYVKSIHNSD